LYRTEIRKFSVRQATGQTYHFISTLTTKYFYRKRHKNEDCNKAKLDWQ